MVGQGREPRGSGGPEVPGKQSRNVAPAVRPAEVFDHIGVTQVKRGAHLESQWNRKISKLWNTQIGPGTAEQD